MTPTAPIHQEMSVLEIVEQFPETAEVFERHGIHVVGYKALNHENLRATARVHQLDETTLVHELNMACTPH